MFRRIGSLVLLLLLAAPVLCAAAEKATVKEGGAVVREGLGLGYPQLGRLREGERVEVLERRETWVLVGRPDGVQGWVHQSFLEGLPERPPPEELSVEDRREQRRRERDEMQAARRAEQETRRQASQEARERKQAEEKARKQAKEAKKARKQEEKARKDAGEAAGRDGEQAAPAPEGKPPGEEVYKPLDMDQILDEVVTGIHEEDSVGPAVVQPGPEPPPTPRLVRPERPEPAAPRTEEEEEERRSDTGVEWVEMRPPSPQAVVLEEVVVRIDDDLITKSQLDERLRVLDQLPDAMGADEMDPDRHRSTLIPRMVDEKLLMSRAEAMGVDREKVYQAAKRDRMQNWGIENDLELATFLDRAGLDLGYFRDTILRNYLPMLVLQRDVRDRIRITTDEVERYYLEHTEEFLEPEMIRLREIVLLRGPEESDKDLQLRLVQLLSRLEEGEDFAEVARRVSQAPSAVDGGDLGVVTWGVLASDMEERVFRLVDGELAAERTDYGYHIVLVEEHRMESIRPLEGEEVEERIREQLHQEQYEEMLQDYLKALRNRAFIQVAPKYAEDYGNVEY